jgi:hypothetical protein
MSQPISRCLCLLGALLCMAAVQAGERSGLPLPPPGVSDLRFGEFFRLPVGRMGLEPSARLTSLSGQRVRVLGYVVGEEEPTPGVFMLTANPVTLAEVADGPADDLPPATLYVHLAPADASKVVAHRPGLLVLNGVLELGNKQEPNGRTSFARLRLDQPLPAAEPAAVAAQATHHAH